MKRFIAALALMTAASVGIAGCGGDDDDEPSGAAGKGGTAGKGNTGGEPASNGGETGDTGGTPSGNVSCDDTQDGVCQNPMDCPFVIDGTARITAGQCGKDCVMTGGDENCSRDCVLEALDMSSECATCYADTVNCTIMNCLGVCLADPEAVACKECQVEKGCRAAFDECSGLPE